jgi:hypothetical protein
MHRWRGRGCCKNPGGMCVLIPARAAHAYENRGANRSSSFASFPTRKTRSRWWVSAAGLPKEPTGSAGVQLALAGRPVRADAAWAHSPSGSDHRGNVGPRPCGRTPVSERNSRHSSLSG